MWVSPSHPNPPRPRPEGPPPENGHRVATFERHGREELRVNLAEYEGHPYLSLRVWAPGQDGQLWPVKGKGLSVKLREVAGLAEALTSLAQWLDSEGGAQWLESNMAGAGGGDRRGGRPAAHASRGQGQGPQRRPTTPGPADPPGPSPRPDAGGSTPQIPPAVGTGDAFNEFQDGAEFN